MTYDRSNFGPEDLERLLDTYGADRERWPKAERARAEPVLASGGEAARLLAEADALDRVLARAPLPDPTRRAALADRILAEARGSRTRDGGRELGTVIAWPRAAHRTPAQATAPTPRSRAPWQAAALLAASLALGVFIGALDLAPTPVSQLAQAVDFDPDSDQMAGLLGGDGLASALDEDFL